MQNIYAAFPIVVWEMTNTNFYRSLSVSFEITVDTLNTMDIAGPLTCLFSPLNTYFKVNCTLNQLSLDYL